MRDLLRRLTNSCRQRCRKKQQCYIIKLMKAKTSYLFLVTLLLAGSLSQIVSDLYLPSLPAIALAFKVPVNWVQWSIAIYIWGVSLSQLIYGPISDGLGRKRPLVFALSCLLAGSVICWAAPSITYLIVGLMRHLQRYKMDKALLLLIDQYQ